MSSKTILMTGSEGFIGSFLKIRLLESNLLFSLDAIGIYPNINIKYGFHIIKNDY